MDIASVVTGRKLPRVVVFAPLNETFTVELQDAPLAAPNYEPGRYMYMRAILFSGLLLFVPPPFLSAGELWTDIRGGFGAMFPDKPEKVGGETSQGSGYAYQGAKSFPNGGALYAITVVPVPLSIEPNSFKRFLAGSHIGFVKSMGGDPDEGETNWLSFGDGRERLAYDFDFTYSGIRVKPIVS